MVSHKHIQIIRWSVIILSLIIVALILWNTYAFFQNFKTEERQKMEVIASAQKEIANNTNINAGINFPLQIIENNKSIPMIWVSDTDKILGAHNLDSIKSLNSNYLKKQLAIMKSQNEPIELNIKTKNGTLRQYI